MEIHADFSKRIVIHTEELDWVASPMPGVCRRMLDRIGGEVARATSVVRYDPHSHFSPHVHAGGEEFVVLEGVFQDEHGDYPAGSYIRNPPTTRHTPGSELGCVIFVKLWQFRPDERELLRIDTTTATAAPHPTILGATRLPLFSDDRETVAVERWPGQAHFELEAPEGAELFVLAGGFSAGDRCRRHSWLRLPIGDRMAVQVDDGGAQVWIKHGHLRFVEAPPAC